jgi:hypothetical protein
MGSGSKTPKMRRIVARNKKIARIKRRIAAAAKPATKSKKA